MKMRIIINSNNTNNFTRAINYRMWIKKKNYKHRKAYIIRLKWQKR